MKLFIVRHAQSERNAYKLTQDDAELTDIGHEQARRLGKYFHDKKIDLVFCSKLKRAKSTLKEIMPHIKIKKVIYTVDLNEHNMGEFGKEGKDDWGSYYKAAEESGKSYEKFKPKYGDSLSETFKRARRFYKMLLRRYKDKNILIVGHGISAIYLILNALELDIYEEKYYHLNNASVSTLSVEEGKVKDFHINDYHHLILGGMKKDEN